LFFLETKGGVKKSHVFDVMEYFTNHVALVDIAGVMKLFPGKHEEAHCFTPKETDDFNRYCWQFVLS